MKNERGVRIKKCPLKRSPHYVNLYGMGVVCERPTGDRMVTLQRFILDVSYQPRAPVLNTLAAPVVSCRLRSPVKPVTHEAACMRKRPLVGSQRRSSYASVLPGKMMQRVNVTYPQLLGRRKVILVNGGLLKQNVTPSNESLTLFWPESSFAMFHNLFMQLLIRVAHPRLYKLFPMLRRQIPIITDLRGVNKR